MPIIRPRESKSAKRTSGSSSRVRATFPGANRRYAASTSPSPPTVRESSNPGRVRGDAIGCILHPEHGDDGKRSGIFESNHGQPLSRADWPLKSDRPLNSGGALGGRIGQSRTNVLARHVSVFHALLRVGTVSDRLFGSTHGTAWYPIVSPRELSQRRMFSRSSMCVSVWTTWSTSLSGRSLWKGRAMVRVLTLSAMGKSPGP